MLDDYFTFSRQEVSKYTIREYLNSLTLNNRKEITVNKHLTILRTFFNWAEKNEFIRLNPTNEIQFREGEERLVTVIRKAQMEKLYNEIEHDNSLRVQDITMFDLFYGTGIRTDELCNLKFEDLNTKKGQLRIRKGKGGKQRVVAVPQKTLDALKKYIAEVRLIYPMNEFLFPSRRGLQMRGSTVYIRIAKILTRLVDKKKGAHTLRHSFATVMLEENAPMVVIKEQLGHTSMETTQLYTHMAIGRLKSVHEKAHPKG